jgi:hypothetical protein
MLVESDRALIGDVAREEAMQQKISSKSTFFFKTLFPIFWFGFLAFLIVTELFSGVLQKAPTAFIVPFLMAAIGFVVLKKLVWDLVDEVYDCGDRLLVRNNGQEAAIRLSEIMNVSVSTTVNPPRITLRLVNPSPFGAEIAFSPMRDFTFNLFAKYPIAEDLIVRVDKARSTRNR